MAVKLGLALSALCLFVFLIESHGAFIKGKNVPRVGRSNEGDMQLDHTMGYVIKQPKHIPRMGRRNYDSDNHYDIPKYYQVPQNIAELYDDDRLSGINQEQMADYYESQIENLQKK